jgi:hypothetical protein
MVLVGVLGMVAVDDGSGEKDADPLGGAERFLLKSAEHLQKGIEYAVRQLNSRKISDERKMRWIRSLTRQIEALVKVVEALHNIGSKSAGSINLATFLSSVAKELPMDAQTPSMDSATSECRTAMRRASPGMSGVRRASARRD